MVICLERGADLHMAQLMPLPRTVSCFSKIQIGFTFLVPAHLGSRGKRAVKRVFMCILHDKHNQNINSCSALCVFIGCLCISKGRECLAENYWTEGYDPVNDLSEIWTAVHTEIVCGGSYLLQSEPFFQYLQQQELNNCCYYSSCDRFQFNIHYTIRQRRAVVPCS